MVGKTISGTIQRVECEAYEYTVPESGETITMSYRWDYVPEEAKVVPAFDNGLVMA